MRVSPLVIVALGLLLAASLVGIVYLSGRLTLAELQLTSTRDALERAAGDATQTSMREARASSTLQALISATATPVPRPVATPALPPSPTAPAATRIPVVAPRTPTTPTAPAAPAASATGVATPAEQAELRAIETRVQALRGLKAKAEVPLSFLDRDGLRAYLQKSFDKDYPVDEREDDQRRLEALGLLMPGEDIGKLVLDLYSQEVVGLYDPDSKQMYLVTSQTALSPDDKVTFAHEFTHALQDQYFDLKKLSPDHPANEDQSQAVSGLVEGDAVLSMFAWARDALSQRDLLNLGQGSDGAANGPEGPRILREELLFPYTSGFEFVQRVHTSGGYPAVDAAFRSPPESTEQVLHPEKFQRRESPVVVDLPTFESSLGPGWTERKRNVMGELDTRILVEQYADAATAERAAAGWGGDRYAYLSDGTRTALALRWVWDTPSDATEFHDAYLSGLETRFDGQATVEDQGSGRTLVVSPEYSVRVEIANQEVMVLIGSDQDVVSKLEGAFGA